MGWAFARAVGFTDESGLIVVVVGAFHAEARTISRGEPWISLELQAVVVVYPLPGPRSFLHPRFLVRPIC